MKTPREYFQNLQNKIVTKQMLVDCLYSVNKRAKNCRDKEREYRQEYQNNYHYFRYNKFDNEYAYRQKKEQYYQYKEELLSILTPTCIHKEPWGYERKRIKDIDDVKEYQKHLMARDFVWANCYLDYETGIEVYFVDIELKNRPIYHYYLFYDLGEHTFHTPIENPEEYPDLEIIEINKLETEGHEIIDLISMQFVMKVIALIESGDYQYQN